MNIFKNNEPMSSLTHGLGWILAIVALVVLIVNAVKFGTVWHVVAFSIFGASLILLYLASTLYHLFSRQSRTKQVFRRIDMSFIFVLIAGTYTPLALIPLRGVWGWSLLALIWALALGGIAGQIFRLKLKAWMPAVMYLSMGWLVVLALPVLFRSISPAAFTWLLAGGLFYSVGVIFYGLENKFKRLPVFGMHDIFHLFVLAGSFCHFWLMYRFI